MKLAPLLLTITAAAAAAAITTVFVVGVQRRARPELPPNLTPPRPLPAGGDFTLSAADGRFSLADHRGQVVVLAFGYTSCPDICPTSLATLGAALKATPPEVAEQVVPVFVSVDPDRDTVERLAGYVRYFHPRLRGITGTAAEVAAVAERYEVHYARVYEADGRYSVDHSAEFHVLDRAGRPSARLAHDVAPEVLASAIRAAAASGPVAPTTPAPAPTAPVAAAPTTPVAAAATAVMVHDAYVRAVAPGATVSAAFMMLHNPTAAARALVAAASPAATTVELHTHQNDGGVMRMRQVERIDVPAGGQTTLAPGGYHVMLIGLTGPLTEGTTVPLTLDLRRRRPPHPRRPGPRRRPRRRRPRPPRALSARVTPPVDRSDVQTFRSTWSLGRRERLVTTGTTLSGG
jgi:protein SCO1/2